MRENRSRDSAPARAGAAPTKRVLFLCSQPFFQWRGSPIRVGFNLAALGEMGYAVDFVTLPIGEPREIPGVNILRVRNLFRARRISIGPSALKAGFDLLILLKALQLLGTRRYDVVHCVEDTGPLGVWVARLARARLIFEKHSDPSSYRKRGIRNLVMWLYARVERFSARAADAVIGTGEGLVRQIRAAGARNVHLIFDIPSSLEGADPARVELLGRTLRRSPEELLITYVGSFAVYQGLDLLFQAIPEVVRDCPRARFVIIGGREHEIRERTAELQRAGVADSVTWAGWVAPDRLVDYLAASDLLLSPRLSGVNTPLKLLDYLKAGRAVVATDVPANRFILDDTNALLVPPEPRAFAGGILRLARDPDLRRALAANGLKLIRETYNFAAFKSRLGEVYRSVAARDDREPPAPAPNGGPALAGNRSTTSG